MLGYSSPLFGVKNLVGDRVHLPDGLHGIEGLQVCLNGCPLLCVLFGGDGGERVCVIVTDVVFELDGDGACGVLGQLCKKLGVSLVGEWVAAGFDDCAGVEVAVGEVVIDAVVVCHDEAQRSERTIDAVDVEVFGLLVGAANVEHLQSAYFGHDVDEAGVEMASETGFVSILLPVLFGGYLEEFVLQLSKVVAWNVLGETAFVKDGLGSGDVGKEAADREAVDADGGLFAADDVGEVEAVGLVEGGAEQGAGDFEADMLEVARGGEASFAELVDVEGELGLDVLVGAFGVVDDGAVMLS